MQISFSFRRHSGSQNDHDSMQGRYLWHLGSLLFFVALSLLGLYCFTRGFLLKRVELPFRSSSDAESRFFDYQPRFQRALILVVDALKYEFLAYNGRLPPETTRAYQNKVPIIDRLVRNHPQNAALFKFIADPPTTTMQRIKGLTTGSLPTFVDVSLNFAASSVGEDNIIDQTRRLGKNVTFMGDDTWVNLYPDNFTKVIPFPSFDVKDLDGVDNGVWQNLLPEMRAHQASIIIAHTLGVDHCGHRYGRDHPEMARKLSELNGHIKSIIREMDENTILFVMGDHGMTRTGDHGGDSVDEIEAGLFVYSPQPFIEYSKYYWASVHSPGCNVMDALFPLDGSPEVGATVSQVDFVPTLSLLLGHPIPFSNLGSVIPSFFPVTVSTAHTAKPFLTQRQALRINADQVMNFLRNYSHTSPELSPALISDLETMYRAASSNQSVELWKRFFHTSLSYCRSVWAKFDDRSMWFGIMFVGVSVMGIVLVLLFTAGLLWLKDVLGLIAAVLASFHMFSMFSNSFQVREDFSVVVIVQGLMFLHFIRSCPRTKPWLYVFRFLCCNVLIRSVEFVRRCREEQSDCSVTVLAMGYETLEKGSQIHTVRLCLVLAVAAGTLMWSTRSLWNRTAIKTTRASLFMLLLAFILFVIIGAQLFEQDPFIRLTAAPRLVYATAMLMLILLFIFPAVLPGISESHPSDDQSEIAIPENETFFQNACLLFLIPFICGFTILLNAAWIFQLIFLLFLSREHLLNPRASSMVATMIIWGFLAWQSFFATGHQTAFPTLHWEAAFMGIRAGAGNSPVLPALLVTLETYAGQILMALAVPSLLTVDGSDTFWLANKVEFYLELWRMCLGYLLFHTGKLFFVMVNASINRRHLMVWKIFAPRFMFEGGSFVTTCLFLILAYLYALRIFFFVQNHPVPLLSLQSHVKRPSKSDSERGSRKRR